MKKTIVALFLAAALLSVLFSGCGDGAAVASQTAQEIKAAEAVYRAEVLPLDETYQISSIDAFCVSGTRLFFGATCVTGTEVYTNPATGEPVMDAESGEPREVDVTGICLFRMDLDTRETVRLEPYQPLEAPEGQQGSAFLLAMAAGADGTVWTLESVYPYFYDLPEDFDAETGSIRDYYVQGEPLTALNQYDADGVKLQSLAVDAAYPQQLLLDQNGNFYIRTENTICLLDSQGELLAELDNSDGSELFQISGTEIGILEKNGINGSTALRLIDPAAGAFGEKIGLASGASSAYPGFGDYQYLYSTGGDTVCGFNPETEEEEMLLSWPDSGVSGSSVNGFAALDDGRIVALSWDSAHSSPSLLCLNQVEASSLPQKQTLTLACVGLDGQLKQAITEFNQSQDDVEIEINDYTKYNTAEDYTAGITRLNTEILAGDMPDILCIGGSLPVEQYAAKGILIDLWPLIDSDESLSREDLMTHLFDVLSVDGKLYQAAGNFMIATAVGNADVIGDRTGWTLEEMLEVKESIEDCTQIFRNDTKSNCLFGFLYNNLDRFLDWETQTCRFDSEEFIEILNLANTFPAEMEGTSDSAENIQNLQTGKQLLWNACITRFEDMQALSFEVGGNPCYVGFPSSNGTGSTFLISSGLAITTACQNVDLAWQFVRGVLTEGYGNWGYSLPTNRHAFEALVEDRMTPEYMVDPITGEVQIDPETGEKIEVRQEYGVDGIEILLKAMTQEEYDTFMRLYESCNSTYSYDVAVFRIIQEETAPFFDGQKTAEEAAALIQNRVGLYVMEQG